MSEIVVTVTAHDLEPGPAVPAKLARLISGWLANYTGATRTAYTADIELLSEFLTDHGVDVLTMDPGHAAGWMEALRQQEPPLAESTIARRLAGASSFFKYCMVLREVDRNPFDAVRRPQNLDSGRQTWLDQDQVPLLLAAAEAHSERAHALIHVMIATGARIGEVLRADADDVGHVGGHRVIHLVRKGGKRVPIPIAATVGIVLDAYLDGRTDGPLFATRGRKGGLGRLDQQAANRLLKKLCGAAELPDPDTFHPHSLRHTAITIGFDKGVPLDEMQEFAGHANADTTRVYNHRKKRLERSPAYTIAAAIAR